LFSKAFAIVDIILYILAGCAVGFAIGLTGIGGGSLMTPLLIAFGFPLPVAIGTDLLFAAITKANGVFLHHQRKNINWNIVKRLSYGSIPSSILTALILKKVFGDASNYSQILTISLGVMLLLTSLVLIFKDKITQDFVYRPQFLASFAQRHYKSITIGSGVFLGIFVTLSSVGAGAFGTAILIMLYPKLRSANIIGTDLAHAVPLTMIAGLGHLIVLGTVNLELLACLIIGSLPAVYVGTILGSKLPEKALRTILGATLFILGLYFTVFKVSGH
jgi:uncharacterized protein